MRKLLIAAIVATAAMAIGATSANAAGEIRAYAGAVGDSQCGVEVNCGAEIVTVDRPTITNLSWGNQGCGLRLQMVLSNSGDGSAVDVSAYPTYVYTADPSQTASRCSNASLCEAPWQGEFTATTSDPSSIELELDWCHSLGFFGGWRGPVTLYPTLADPAPGATHGQLTRATSHWEPLTGYGSLTGEDEQLLADFTETPHEMHFDVE